MSERMMRGPAHAAAHAASAPRVEPAPPRRTPAEQVHDRVVAFRREVDTLRGTVDAVHAAHQANDPERWTEARGHAAAMIERATRSLASATAQMQDATPGVAEQLDAAARALEAQRGAVSSMTEAPTGFAQVAGERELLAVFAAPLEGGARLGFAKKQHALEARFDQLTPADRRVLAARMRRGRPNDPIATAFSRLTQARRAGLLAHLASADQRAAQREEAQRRSRSMRDATATERSVVSHETPVANPAHPEMAVIASARVGATVVDREMAVMTPAHVGATVADREMAVMTPAHVGATVDREVAGVPVMGPAAVNQDPAFVQPGRERAAREMVFVSPVPAAGVVEQETGSVPAAHEAAAGRSSESSPAMLGVSAVHATGVVAPEPETLDTRLRRALETGDSDGAIEAMFAEVAAGLDGTTRRAVAKRLEQYRPGSGDDIAARFVRLDGALRRRVLADLHAAAPTAARQLPDGIRCDLEAATGTSLAHVQLHADGRGSAIAAAHGARAVAIGSDIYVGEGELDATTPEGRELIAHEVAHVVQARAPVRAAHDGDATEAAEVEADGFAALFRERGAAASWQPTIAVTGGAAMRAPERAPTREGWSAKLDNQLSIAERQGISINAPGFVHLHLAEVRRAAHVFLATRPIPSGDPQVALRDGFFDALFEAFDGSDAVAGVTRLRNWLAPADLYVIVDRNRPIFDAQKAQRGRPDAAPDYTQGPKGPPHWVPAVGTAIGSALESHLIASLARMSPRLVAVTAQKRAAAHGAEPEAVRPKELVSSHPLDWHVALAMVGRATPGVEVKAGALKAGAPVTYRKVKQVEWQGARGGAWNAVRVLDPRDANLEEVAAALLGKSTEAHRLQRVGPFVVVPPEDAARFPDAKAHQGSGRTGVAALAFGNAAAVVETAELEHALAQAAGAHVPAATAPAALQASWQHIHEQLQGIAIVVRPFLLDTALAGAFTRHAAHKLDLAALAGHAAVVRGELFARQGALLAKIAAEIGATASRAGMHGTRGAARRTSVPGDAATRTALQRLVRAATLSHLVETGEAALAEAHEAQRDTILDTLEALLGQAATQIEIARLTASHTQGTRDRSKAAFGAAFEQRADVLRQRLADLRSKLLGGHADPAEIQSLYAGIDALRFETGLVAQVGQLGQLFDVLDKLESSNWVLFSEGLTSKIVGETSNENRIGRLEKARRGAHELRGDLQTIHSRWLKVERSATAIAEHLATGGSKDPKGEAARVVLPQVNAIRAQLTQLGGREAIQTFLREAFDTADDAQTRAMVVQIAAMIGVAIASSGVGVLAEGVAVGLGASVIGAQLAGLVVETAAFTLLDARLSGEPIVRAFATNFVGNLATFGALRVTRAVIAGSAIGRTLARAKGGERVAKVALLAAKTGELTAPMLVALGVQFAQAEAESLLRHGRTLSMDELMMTGVQGIAMMIGGAISHKLLAEPMGEAKAFGADHAGRLAQRAHLKKLANEVMASGDPSQALDLMREAHAFVEAELAKSQELRALPANEIESRGLTPQVVDTMGKRAQSHAAALDAMAGDTLPAQLGLETRVPGHVYAGDPDAVARVLDGYRARGFTIEAEPGGHRIERAGQAPLHIIERGASASSTSSTTAPRAVTQVAVAPQIADFPPDVQSRLQEADAALAARDVHAAIVAFDKIAGAIPPDQRAKIESSMAKAHGVTDPVIYRDPYATLPNGTKIKPSARNDTVFYGTQEPPNVVFERGLGARGSNSSLLEHVSGSDDSAFRGTTHQILSQDGQGAGAWADDGGWVYKIDGVATWDVNAMLQGRVPRVGGRKGDNPMHGEHEYSMLANVARERIVGAYGISERNGVLRPGPMVPNPRYVPRK